MKFIFPQDFNFKNKIFGILDYPTAIFNLIYFLLVWNLSSLFVSSLLIKIFILIIFYFPIFLISVINISHENILYFFWYMLKFIIKPKLYLYK